MQIPTRRAYHVVYDSSLLDALKYASEHNWTGIVPDFNVPHFSPEKFSSTDREKLLEVSTNLNIEWGFHAPGDDISLYDTYPPIRKGINEYIKQIIDFAREVSANQTNLVIHVGTPPSFKQAGDGTDKFSETHHDLYAETLSTNILNLIDYAYPDVDITLENHAWISLTREVVRTLIRKGLKLCLDIVKLYSPNLVLKEDDWMIFAENCEVIEVVHIHDFIVGLGSHQIVGKGVIDFEPSLRLLANLIQSAQYVFEVRPKNAAQESLNRFTGLLKDLNLNLV
jgi:sugar phosphate isomerase/epimerase